MTELTFNRSEAAIAAIGELKSSGSVNDDYGHVLTTSAADIAATVYADLDAELRGALIVASLRMRMQAEAQRQAQGPQGR